MSRCFFLYISSNFNLKFTSMIFCRFVSNFMPCNSKVFLLHSRASFLPIISWQFIFASYPNNLCFVVVYKKARYFCKSLKNIKTWLYKFLTTIQYKKVSSASIDIFTINNMNTFDILAFSNFYSQDLGTYYEQIR